MTPTRKRALLDVLNNAAKCIEAMNVEKAPGAAIIVKHLRDQVRLLREDEQSTQVYRREHE